MSRRVRGFFVGLLGFVLVLAILAAAGGVWTVRRSFPQVDGEMQMPGLDGPVQIARDSFGIPHIYAGTTHDLFFAQGYVHAQDRFWQMDFWRHISSGRLSELFGESQLETDRFLRTLGWARIAAEEWETVDPQGREILEAYSDGINAYLADHSGSALSLEYAVLKLMNAGYRPEPWQPVHSLAWAKVMAWDLRGNMDEEIERAILLEAVGSELAGQLFPAYPQDAPVIVPGPYAYASAQGTIEAETQIPPAALPAIQAAGKLPASLRALLGAHGTGVGSNSWVLAGERTSTGKPILANDPHLSAQMPSIWYEVGLHCEPKGEACPYEVAGFSFAGAPGVIIGHNDRIAWGFTNVGPDVQDLYIEKINPENPDQYEYQGQWEDMQVIQETLNVAGGEPETLTIRSTRHGPLITSTYGKLEEFSQRSGVDLPEQYAIALRWTALELSTTFNAVWKMNRAQNWDEFRAAASDFSVPSQNLVYADVDGNIGYQMPGRIPIRSQGDGRLPVPGWTGEWEWTGYIPFEQLPHLFNPPQGYIVTANHAVVDESYPHMISLDWDYGSRAIRIHEMISSRDEPFSPEDMAVLQGDNKNLNAERLVPMLMDLELEDTQLEEARDLLAGWDFQSHMDSAPAVLFEAFWYHLQALTFRDNLPEDYWPTGGARWYTIFNDLVEQPASFWWDDVGTSQKEGRDDIFWQAFSQAVDDLRALQGNDPAKWRWGDLHTVEFRNGSLGESGIAPIEALFNRGPYPTSGGSGIVNATSWDATEGYSVAWLPSMRMIVDLSDLSNSRTVNTLGQSGHAYHPHYNDMVDLWRTIQYHPMLWERGAIETSAEGVLRLAP